MTHDQHEDALVEQVAEIIHYDICDSIPQVDSLSYLEGPGHSERLQSESQRIIALVRADERKRVVEIIESTYDEFRCENTDGMGDRDPYSEGYLEGLSFAIGISTEDAQ